MPRGCPTVVNAAGSAIAIAIIRSSVNQRRNTVAAVCPDEGTQPVHCRRHPVDVCGFTGATQRERQREDEEPNGGADGEHADRRHDHEG